MNTETKPTLVPAEVAGREYNSVRFGLHSRKLGTTTWYGLSNYKTEQFALDALQSTGQQFVNVGGLVLDFGASTEVYEYRIVRIEAKNTVLQTAFRKF